jgi:hypothetical protein
MLIRGVIIDVTQQHALEFQAVGMTSPLIAPPSMPTIKSEDVKDSLAYLWLSKEVSTEIPGIKRVSRATS